MGKVRTFDLAVRAAWDSFKGTTRYLGIVFSLGLLTFQFVTKLRDWFGLRLLPVFEKTLDEVHHFLQLGMEWLFYHWIALALDYGWYFVALAVSCFIPLAPYLPSITIPASVKDAGFISILLLRVFESAYLAVPRVERDAARAETTDEQKKAIEQSLGRWRTLHYCTEEANRAFYNFSDWLISKLTSPLAPLGLAEGNLPGIIVRKAVREIFGGMIMLGYVRLVGYLIYVSRTLNINSPRTVNVRKTFAFFVLCLVVALIAAMIFTVANSLLLSS